MPQGLLEQGSVLSELAALAASRACTLSPACAALQSFSARTVHPVVLQAAVIHTMLRRWTWSSPAHTCWQRPSGS